ncbi:D-aminoacylase [Fodinicurvata sp. EGI_FJ10296]|uniref:N-acyl-D-amino-acid deacylase family protein n=1 Tax=Fodinicurvata sp. EGI_FJ10296 TaxID=3231908 RepID=UPI00345576CD
MTQIDIAITNATIVDGSGRPGFRGTVYLSGDRIASVVAEGDGPGADGPGPATPARRTIDAGGRILAPGFIDVHTHDDVALIVRPEMPEKLTQGVTSVIAGHCGFSPFPLPASGPLPQEFGILLPDDRYRFPTMSSYLRAVADAGPAVNYMALAGHSALRVAAMSDLTRAADRREISTMISHLEEALDAGAIGLSSGLAYAMARGSDTAELVSLAAAMRGATGGFYVTHLRDEGDGLIDAVEEALTIGREGGVPVIFSHHKATGAANHGKTAQSLALIDAARAHQRIGIDAYPYTFSSTALTIDRVRRGGVVVVARSGTMPEMTGKRLDAVAAELGCDIDAAVERLQPAGALYFAMDDDDVDRVLAFAITMIGSDGLPFDPRPHPRLWGTFPRVLGRYVRERGVLTLEDAVYRMTGLVADTFGIASRGRIAPDLQADIVLFDDSTIADAATAEDPLAPSLGIDTVIVNGRIAIDNGRLTRERAGTRMSLIQSPLSSA